MKQRAGAAQLVSVVIPAYNEERYIQRCINSLLEQSYPSMEVIFIDDGSKDRTREILKAAARTHKNLHVFFRNHGGPGAARNYGAQKAKGSILVFVDADMIFDPEYIEALTAPIRNGKTHGTFHTKELVANKENLWARSWCINRIAEGTKESGVYRAILKKQFLASGGFDASQGYFDDNLGKLGSATPAPAVCYHNNPETLGEVFKHSMWVGKSLLQSTATRRKMAALVTASLFLFAASIILLVMGRPLLLVIGVICAALAWLFISLRRTVPRVRDERRPEYLLSIPALWAVRLLGYYAGALHQLFRMRG
jgi:cellulose synthase/poly-beta-1,6-N-acetylglucosamine synthase-like glycosyltransferase